MLVLPAKPLERTGANLSMAFVPFVVTRSALSLARLLTSSLPGLMPLSS